MYLLDTNVISELRRPKPHGAVLAWFDSIPAQLVFVPAPAIGEIQIGVERVARHNQQKAVEISDWLDTLVATAQIAEANAATFRICAKLVVRSSPVLVVDALIAATALHGDMTVVTRNVRDFADFGVSVSTRSN